VVALDDPGNDIMMCVGFQWVDEEHFAFVDMVYSKQASVFRADGSLVCRVGKQGQGPGEYKMPRGITRGGSGDWIVIESGPKIHRYASDCTPASSFPAPFSATISRSIRATESDNLLAGVFSRYSDQSLFLFDESGELVKAFSPPDEAFGLVFDTFYPQGGVVLGDQKIYQYFNHEYGMRVFDLEGNQLEDVQLYSSIYKAPDLGKARKVSGHREEKAFLRTFTAFVFLDRFKDGYVTVLRESRNGEDRDTVEFWSHDFTGYGRYAVPSGEKLIGTRDNELIFFKVVEAGSVLLFRSFSGWES
jgi:hypothetical protein